MLEVDIKQLSGILNSDASNEVIPPSHHKMAYNIFWREGRPQNVPGTTEIAYTKPTGTNECIGAFYDEKGGRIFWFLWNSLGNHSIWQYTIKTKATASLAVENTNTASGVLDFELNYPIYGVRILIGDTINGDELWFINSQRKPCKINIARALSGAYGTIQSSFISVNFAPPIMSPFCIYLNDAAVTVNNMRGLLFRYKIRFINESKNKSVTSIEAEMPLPVNYLDSAIDKDPTKNCRVGIVYPTGNSEVKKIEILVAQSSGNGFGDFQLVKTVDKSVESIANNDLAVFYFYNSEAYVSIDVRESLQLYDLVPLRANDLEMLNGNVPIYCCITEGYNPIEVDGATTSASTPQQTTQLPYLFKATQSGDSGFGTGNIHAIVLGAVGVGDVFNIYTTAATITFTCTVATTANVIAGLAAAAIVAGFTVVSSDTENLVIIKTNESLQRVLSTPVARAVTDSYAYDWNSRYGYVLQYFYENGITIGSQTDSAMAFQTVNYTETATVPNISKLTLSISNRPPLEAKYFSIGRPKNLTKLKWLYWVCRATYKDTEFAYIDIENLNSFIKVNPKSAHLAWDASAKDRIRFIKRLSAGANTIYTDNDFEIQSQSINPTINGEEKTGQFFKILLPTTSGTFDFGSEDFLNYYIQIYTPALLTSEGYNFYFEFGERFTIGDAGLATRYHQGMTQNQTSNLSQPALFEFTKGDAYLRNRKIQTGGELDYEIGAGEISAGRHTMGVTFEERTFADSTILTGNSPLQDLSGWTFASTARAILRRTGGSVTKTFKAKGSISVDPLDDDTFYFFLQKQDGTIIPVNTVRGVTDSPQVLSLDATFDLAASEHISFLGWSESDYTNPKKYFVTDLKITVENSYTVPVIDQNFSDYFPSAVNSNARVFEIDKNAQQAEYKNLLRWGLARNFDTNLNQTNRFYDQNAAEVDLGKGKVWRLVARERQLRLFQETGVAVMGVYKNILTQADGSNLITATDEIITKNNFDYYSGLYGLGNQPTSLVSGKSRDFFIDPIRGYQCMVGESGGIVPISEIYNGQYFIQPLFPNYNNPYLRSNGSLAKIMGYYDYGEDLYMTILQGGTLATFPTISDYVFGFRDGNNPGYTSFFNLTEAEWILSAEDKTYSWKNGSFYIHNNTSAYCNFYGTQYIPSVRVVFNDKVAVKKSYYTSAYIGNQKWSSDRFAINTSNADSIKTSFFNPDTGFQQISELKTVDYSIEEGKYCAALLKDKNSGLDPLLAVLEGDELMGNWIEIEYLYRGSEFAWIFLPQVLWTPSNRNF